MSELLDSTRQRLEIFTKTFEVDYSLPKFKAVLEKVEEYDRLNNKSKSLNDITNRYAMDEPAYDSDTVMNSDPRVVMVGDGLLKTWDIHGKRQEIAKKKKGVLVNEEFFNSLDADSLQVFIDEQKVENGAGILRDASNSLARLTTDLGVSYVDQQINKLIEVQGGSWYRNNAFARWFRRLIGVDPKRPLGKFPYKTSGKEEEKKEEPNFDVLKFFDVVKLTAKKEIVTYCNRTGPLLVAIKEAKEMGQTALVEQLLGKILISKYESLLFAKGMRCKISEAQVVQFAKNSTKGVSLSYIKNFTRPIPEEVRKKKLEADSLHIFDNYCILYYDPKGIIYKQTQKEVEEERRRKADPILFGMIEGSTDLYYIADWIDEYCDLTLEKFIEVSGLSKKSLKIDEKIKI